MVGIYVFIKNIKQFIAHKVSSKCIAWYLLGFFNLQGKLRNRRYVIGYIEVEKYVVACHRKKMFIVDLRFYEQVLGTHAK